MSVEDGLALVDTKVLLYAYDRSAGARHERAVALGPISARQKCAINVVLAPSARAMLPATSRGPVGVRLGGLGG
jgi:hypothetical protein